MTGTLERWIPRARLIAVPFAFAEVAIESGNYPPGYERWAWTTAAVFAVGAVALFFAPHPLAGILFDAAIVSAFVCIYSFEPSSPVRELLFLPVVEAGLFYGVRGGLLLPLVSAPSLAFFEVEVVRRARGRLRLGPRPGADRAPDHRRDRGRLARAETQLSGSNVQ